MMDLFHFTPGSTPVLVSVPHAGAYVPPDIAARLTDAGAALPDTDWHMGEIYDFAPSLGVGLLVATHARVVIDLNRDPAGAPLYSGASNTELVPITTFGDVAIWRPGAAPDRDETAARVERYWRPYHDRLAAELDALHARFGVAILWDGHSIRSIVPRFFAGKLPDLNLGTSDGASCDPALAADIFALLSRSGLTAVHDGRFKGGYITRNYGRPALGFHALQLEVGQSCYMDEDRPRPYDAPRAQRLCSILRASLSRLVEWSFAPR
jgi:N-formylglutamate deformylase